MLEALRQNADGSYTLSFRRGAGASEVRARHVVLAVPFTTLRHVHIDIELPPAKRRAIDELRYGTNAKLMIGFDERVWWTRHRSGGSTYSDLPLQTTWETSRMQPGAAGILTNFVGGRHGIEIGEGTPKMQADLAAKELDAIFPGISSARTNAREARFHWPSFPWTLGSYACFTPGQWTTIRGAIGESVGTLHFAGEHCAFDNQGFMEGGVETGEWAAGRSCSTRSTRRSSSAHSAAQRARLRDPVRRRDRASPSRCIPLLRKRRRTVLRDRPREAPRLSRAYASALRPGPATDGFAAAPRTRHRPHRARPASPRDRQRGLQRARDAAARRRSASPSSSRVLRSM